MNFKAELGKMNDLSASGYNEEAMSWYALIDHESSCFLEAEKIYQDYLIKLNPSQKGEWERNLKEMEFRKQQIETNASFMKDSVEMAYAFELKIKEYEVQAEMNGNKVLLEKYKKDHYYERQPWFRKIFHLGDFDPFDGYSEGNI